GSSHPELSLREAHYWDIRPMNVRLLTVLQYQRVRGVPTSLFVGLPANLLVRRVEAARMQPTGPIPRLQGWSVTDEKGLRRLRLDFVNPVASGLQLFIEMVPAGTLGPRPTLELPSPEEVTSSEGLLAFRVEGRQAGVTEHRRVTGIEPESFANIWQLAG